MREVKLRAFHKQEKKMYQYVEHTTYADGSSGVTMLADTDGYSFSPNEDDIELLQYIDFYDTHGKQACQGDIIEINCLGWGETYKTKAVIEYRDFRWWFHMIEKPEGIEWNPVEKKWEPESEIIGTIYKTPELA